MKNKEIVSSVENALRSLMEVLVLCEEQAALDYSSASDLKEGVPQIPFPNVLDQDLDEVMSESWQLREVLTIAIGSLEIALRALEELH